MKANHFTHEQILCALCVIEEHPKWWHRYCHAKKRRIRKKYENIMSREALRIEKSGRFKL